MKNADALEKILQRLQSNASVGLEPLNRGKLPEKGGELFKLGKVGEIRLVGDSSLVASVGRMSPSLRVLGDRLDWRCDCSSHEDFGVCKHVAALAIKALESASRHSRKIVSSASDSLAVVKPSPQLTLRKSGISTFYDEVVASYGIPVNVLENFGLGWAEVDEELNLVAFLDCCEEDDFFSLMNKARIAGLGMRACLGDGTFQDFSFVVREEELRPEIRLDGVRVVLSPFPFSLVGSKDRQLFGSTFLTGEGDLLRLPEVADEMFSAFAMQAHSIGLKLYGRDHRYSPEKFAFKCFNATCLSFDWPELSEARLFGKEDGLGVDIGDIDAEQVELAYLIERPDGKSDDLDYTLEITAWADGKKLHLDELLAQLDSQAKYLSSLVSGSGKKAALVEELERVVKALANGTGALDFEDGDSEGSRSLLEQWSRCRTALQAHPTSRKKCWTKVDMSLGSIAALALSFWPWEGRKVGGTSRAILKRSRKPFGTELLKRVFAAAEAVGAEVKVNNRRAKLDRVQVFVESAVGGWLNSWIRTESAEVDIPAEDWDNLLAGTLYLNSKDKGVVIPIADRPEAVRLAKSLLKKPKKQQSLESERPPGRAPLELLSWLAAAAAGAEGTPPESVDRTIAALSSLRELPPAVVPAALRGTLKNYQIEGLSWLIFMRLNGLGACLADEMGLGKTVQAIAYLAYEKENAKVERLPNLVVCPLSMLSRWVEEISKFCPSLSVVEFHGSSRDLSDLEGADVVLTTFDTLARKLQKLRKQQFGTLVLDEAQFCKSADSKRRKAAAAIDRQFTIAMTGTPLENRVEELVSIMDLALPGFYQVLRGSGLLSYSDANGPALIAKCAQPFVLRRLKRDVLKGLPKKNINVVMLPMQPEQKAVYERMESDAREGLKQMRLGGKPAIAFFAALTRLRQICVAPQLTGISDVLGSPKIEYVANETSRLTAEGRSCLVFSQFTGALDLLEIELLDKGVRFSRIDGKVPSEKRREVVTGFQKGRKPEVLLISLRAGGTGLTLTRASAVFLLDPWWNPAVDDQAVDRAHRIGQTSEVEVYRLAMEGSIEEKVLLLQEFKRRLFEGMVDDPASAVAGRGGLTAEDFRFLLSMGKR